MTKLSSIRQIIDDAKNGKMFILVDDEDRENEGDIVIPAQFANAEVINFMAKHARGLICLSLDKKRVLELDLPLMAQSNKSRHHTAFTVSIEAREGVTTGISAADRAKTIEVAIDKNKNKYDIVSPGHIFPLVAREGGVLVRAGHTEAAVDIARLAGLNPSGVICEIMKDDGTMARLPDLIEFAKIHNLNIATIADLIEYRRKKEKLVERSFSQEIEIENFGKFSLHLFKSVIEYGEHLALVKGDISKNDATLTRMHKLDIISDVLRVKNSKKRDILYKSLDIINKNGSGVLVILRSPDKQSLSKSLEALGSQNNISNANQPNNQLRDYGIGAQILLDLGVRKIKILTSGASITPVAMEGYDLEIVEEIKI